ncbi:F-box protein SNE, partial [Cucurbita argyrosperma subsp. sororia]
MQKNHIPEPNEKRRKFLINDNLDILIEILKRLDGPSLGIATCVCRLWCTIARSESVWEQVCFRHVISPLPASVKSVVVALGGYKRLYMVSIRPVLSRLGYSDLMRRVWTQNEVQLSLSLFCVDYYERLTGNGRLGGGGGGGDASALSLMFLCNTVNV